jgi:hypothetical protein
VLIYVAMVFQVLHSKAYHNGTSILSLGTGAASESAVRRPAVRRPTTTEPATIEPATTSTARPGAPTPGTLIRRKSGDGTTVYAPGLN